MQGVYCSCNVYVSKGVAQCAPVFEYTVNGRHIRAQSAEAMGRRKLEGRYREGERYEIFVDEKHPRLFVLQRRVHLLDVGLLPEFASRFPHEFSGGQRQRIGIARALIVEPEFIIADEPISALDMSIRAQVLNLLRHMQKERGITYLFIAHDLSVMRYISDRIAVIHKGDIVELADAEELVTHAIHPYTRSLLSAIPMPSPRRERQKKLLVYDPSMHDYSTEAPQWRELRPRHWVLCSASEAEDWCRES